MPYAEKKRELIIDYDVYEEPDIRSYLGPYSKMKPTGARLVYTDRNLDVIYDALAALVDNLQDGETPNAEA